MKRISGNYSDRLFYRILPVSIFAVLIIILFSNTELTYKSLIDLSFGVVFPMTSILWLLDSIVMMLKRPANIKTDGQKLIINNDAIDLPCIVQVSENSDVRIKWDFTTLILTYLKNGTVHSVNIIPRPKLNPFDNSLTFELLVKYFPDIKEKIKN